VCVCVCVCVRDCVFVRVVILNFTSLFINRMVQLELHHCEPMSRSTDERGNSVAVLEMSAHIVAVYTTHA